MKTIILLISAVLAISVNAQKINVVKKPLPPDREVPAFEEVVKF